MSFLSLQFQGSVLLDLPRGDGVYTYKRTGDSTGTIDLLYADGSRETLPPLNFTAASSGISGPSPTIIDTTFAFSDLASTQIAPAVNVSMRGRAVVGQPLIVGFVVPGTRQPNTDLRVTGPDANQRDVLIRVVGPSLAQFNLTGFWADPDFRLYRGATLISGTSNGEFHYDDWSSIPDFAGAKTPNTSGVIGFKKIFNYVGAFPLLDGSKDSADVVRLSPGAYTIVCNPVAGDPGGEALIEVYFLP